jgi:hypothetical protein
MVDDALLIDRMRLQQADAVVFVNQIIGKLINFLEQIGELGQTNLDGDMEQATVLGA